MGIGQTIPAHEIVAAAAPEIVVVHVQRLAWVGVLQGVQGAGPDVVARIHDLPSAGAFDSETVVAGALGVDRVVKEVHRTRIAVAAVELEESVS